MIRSQMRRIRVQKLLPGYKKVNPMVYCGLYPADGCQVSGSERCAGEASAERCFLYIMSRRHRWLLALVSDAVSLAFCIWRLFRNVWRENTILILSQRRLAVVYRIHKTNGEMIELTNPSNMPDPSEIEYMEEPIVSAEIMVTTDYIGADHGSLPGTPRCIPWHGIY